MPHIFTEVQCFPEGRQKLIVYVEARKGTQRCSGKQKLHSLADSEIARNPSFPELSNPVSEISLGPHSFGKQLPYFINGHSFLSSMIRTVPIAFVYM